MTVERIRIGAYGNGTIGIKSSLEGFDVSVIADDNDVSKRSFNSEWTNLCKLRILGVAQSEWTQFSNDGPVTYRDTSGNIYTYYSKRRGWEQVTPKQVPTGLSYIPIWEDRVFDPVNAFVYDDYVYPSSNASQYFSSSGGRSYHSGPTTTPANTLFFTPYLGVPGYGQVANENAGTVVQGYGPPPDIPSAPAYPPQPSNKPSLIYLIYANKMGDVA